jgi:hypothetical protein
MIIKESPRNQYDTRNDGRRPTRIQPGSGVQWPATVCQWNWLQHNQAGRDYLDVGRNIGEKAAEKQKGARGSPKRYSDAFCCFVFIAKHGHILCLSPAAGKPAGVTDFKLLFDL